jgi:hypothetical protein
VSGSPIKRRTEVKNTLPIGRIEGSKTPIETHTPLIRYFINDIDPKRTLRDRFRCYAGRCAGGVANAIVPNKAPTPAVKPMAKAPQIVTRIAPTVTTAPPTLAANAPKSARNITEVPGRG